MSRQQLRCGGIGAALAWKNEITRGAIERSKLWPRNERSRISDRDQIVEQTTDVLRDVTNVQDGALTDFVGVSRGELPTILQRP